MKTLLIALALLGPGTTAAGADERAAMVDALFADFDKRDSPGCAVGVIRHGRFVFRRGYGMASVEHHVPIGPGTVMDAGSLAKQFTAASVLLLVEQKKLSLDADIRGIVPELPVYSPTVTIRHLLHHTSGIRDYPSLFALQGVDPSGPITEALTLALLARQKTLNFPPGSDHAYNNSGYFLLALVLKRVSGKSLRDFVQEHFFGPLDMKQTQVVDDAAASIPGRALTYEPTETGGHRITVARGQTVGDGALFTTLNDLLSWDANYYSGKAGGAELTRLLQTRGVVAGGERLDYAGGLFVRKYNGLNVVEHGGDGPGMTAYVSRFPDQRLTVACLCNAPNFGTMDVVHQIAEIYLADDIRSAARTAATSAASVTLSVEALTERVGLYRSTATDVVRRVWLRDGALRIDLPFPDLPRKEQELVAATRDRFHVNGGTIPTAVVFGSDGTFRLERKGRRSETFEPVEEPRPVLDGYEGLYFSEELEAVFNIVRAGGNLQITNLDVTLRPVYRDGFSGSGARVRFVRDANGRVTELLVWLGYNRAVRYVRLR